MNWKSSPRVQRTIVKRMWRRVLFVMLLGAGIAEGACGDQTFSSGGSGDGGSDAGGPDTSTPQDASSDSGPTPDGGFDARLPDPDLIAVGEDNPNDLVLRGGVLYWTTFSEKNGLGAVRSIKADGTGSVRTVARGTHANRLAVDDTQVYWTDTAIPDLVNSFIGISPLAGGGGPTIGGTTEPAGIAVDSTSLYVQFFGEQTISIYSKDGMLFEGTLANSVTAPVSLAVDDLGVTWTDLGPSSGQGIIATSLPDAALIGAATNVPEPAGIALDGPTAFYTTTGLDAATSAGGIWSISRDASVALNLTENETSPRFLAVDATNVYWTNEGSAPAYLDGTVRRINKNGGTPISLALGQQRPRGIAVDATYVYWVNYQGGEIRRLLKP